MMYHTGRHFIQTIPSGSDLIDIVVRTCQSMSIKNAVFSVSGSVGAATTGAFDPKQEVYVTHLEKGPMELLFCQGSFCWSAGKPCVKAKVILADQNGQLTGGHLFSDTIVNEAEIDLQERIEIF